MRAVVMYAPGDVRVDQTERPTIVEPTDAIIKLAATCICGSDLWPYRGADHVDHQPMGHEYAGVVEHSVYVHHEHRRRGHGETLMRALVERAMEHQLHVLVGGIDAANQPSIALHLKLRFRHVGTLPQTGFKFGRWLDLAFYQLTLPTPEHPVDG